MIWPSLETSPGDADWALKPVGSDAVWFGQGA
jgi:hypothetical protein